METIIKINQTSILMFIAFLLLVKYHATTDTIKKIEGIGLVFSFFVCIISTLIRIWG